MTICPRCGTENPDGFRFCGACAAPLEEAAAAPREERKVVTAVFVDLVGFTSRAEGLDPEDVRATLTPYHARVRADLERHGGTVEKFIGDAVMALFGAPAAHEDDAERAVRAALAVRESVALMNEQNPSLDLHVRIGVNTGEALVALQARPAEGEGMAAGDAVNTAARLQSAAPPDGILVGEQTHRATSHTIDYRGPLEVDAKGKAQQVRAWEAIQATARFGVDVTRSLTSHLVGRDREVSLLNDARLRSREDRACQLITIVGEPGIGKSRLVAELFRIVDEEPGILTFWRQGRCLPYGDGVSFWALGEMVKAQAGILETDTDEQAASKLAEAVAEFVDEDSEWVERNLRPLVGIGSGTEVRGGDETTFAAWRRFLEGLAERSPTVLVFEDLHWADDGLLNFVDGLVEWSEGVPLLVVGTARPELLSRRPDWGGGKPNTATISLSPLSDEDTAELLAALLERSVLPAELQSALLARAGGNPLYAEEFARMVADRGAKDDPSKLPLPDSIQGLIAARLDGLDPQEKVVLQDAAVVGKVFWSGAVAKASGSPRAEIENKLHLLARRHFIRHERRSTVAAENEYAFLHVLMRDVAYGQIPRAKRAQLHRTVAEWMTALGERTEDRADLLAHHYRSALELGGSAGIDVSDLREPARLAFRSAGDRAISLSAFASAEQSYREALALWPDDDPDRPDLLLRLARSNWIPNQGGADDALLESAREALMDAGDRGGAAETEIMMGDMLWQRASGDAAYERFRRASELVRNQPPSRKTALVLAHMSRFLMLSGHAAEAIAVGREALALAEKLGADDLRANALNNIGTSRVSEGDTGGLEDLRNSVAIAKQADSPWDLTRAQQNLATMELLLGDVRGSRSLHKQALSLARRLGLVETMRWQDQEMAEHSYYLGDWDEALRLSAPMLDEKTGPHHYMEATGLITRGQIRLARADVSGGLADAELGLRLARVVADPQVLHPVLAEAARISWLAGRRDHAGRCMDELMTEVSGGAVVPMWSWWFVPASFVMKGMGRTDELLRLADRPVALLTPWVEAGLAYAREEFELAADLLERIGTLPDEAFVRLRAAEAYASEGRTAEAREQLQRALGFFRSVGAVRFIGEAERLLAASA